MAVRVEGYRPGEEIPYNNHFIEGNETYMFYPELDRLGVEAPFEAFSICPRLNNLGVNVTVFTFYPDKVDLSLMKFQDDYRDNFSRLLANDKQTITDTKIEFKISPGEAIQYPLLHNSGYVVIWHDTGQDYDLSVFLSPSIDPAIK